MTDGSTGQQIAISVISGIGGTIVTLVATYFLFGVPQEKAARVTSQERRETTAISGSREDIRTDLALLVQFPVRSHHADTLIAEASRLYRRGDEAYDNDGNYSQARADYKPALAKLRAAAETSAPVYAALSQNIAARASTEPVQPPKNHGRHTQSR